MFGHDAAGMMALFGTPVIESPYVRVDDVIWDALGRRIFVREFAQFRWRTEVWAPLMTSLRRDVGAHLASLVADQERRLFG